jgi:DNA-binding PadR family transcriptional regulator
MSAGKAVLGLVIQRPGYGYQLEQRVKERFGSAQFVASSIYKALGRLEKDRLIRVVGGEALEVPDAEHQRRIKYEATPRGVTYFRQWLRASSSVPLVREELQLRLAFCEPHELPRLIEIVHGEELVCLAMLAEFQRGIDNYEAPTGRQEWSRLMDMAVDHAEAGFWDARIRWLQNVRLFLEGLREEADRLMVDQHAGGQSPANGQRHASAQRPADASRRAAGDRGSARRRHLWGVE